MKKLIILILCLLVGKLESMSFFQSYFYPVGRAQYLLQQAQNLKFKNPANVVLHTILDSLPQDSQNITQDNAGEVINSIQPLLFPCNTYIFDRLRYASINNFPPLYMSLSCNPFTILSNLRNYVKDIIMRPVQTGINVGQESFQILQNSVDSLQIVDYAAMGIGYLSADWIAKRNNSEYVNFLQALYVACPLICLCLKKRADFACIAEQALKKTLQKNRELAELKDHALQDIENLSHEQLILQQQNVDLCNQIQNLVEKSKKDKILLQLLQQQNEKLCEKNERLQKTSCYALHYHKVVQQLKKSFQGQIDLEKSQSLESAKKRSNMPTLCGIWEVLQPENNDQNVQSFTAHSSSDQGSKSLISSDFSLAFAQKDDSMNSNLNFTIPSQFDDKKFLLQQKKLRNAFSENVNQMTGAVNNSKSNISMTNRSSVPVAISMLRLMYWK